ncbi:hypothetical protein [Pricia sp.]|uniref:hypothetical protein n=1 Tax=Pricia sp. TaxID=2268138 RepID=UPI0035936F06
MYPTASSDKVRIGFSQAMINDDWRRSMNDAMQLKLPWLLMLTLILSAIESLGGVAGERGGNFMNQVELIYNNSNRLLCLINQLLDFQNAEDRKFALRATKTDLVAFSQSISIRNIHWTIPTC